MCVSYMHMYKKQIMCVIVHVKLSVWYFSSSGAAVDRIWPRAFLLHLSGVHAPTDEYLPCLLPLLGSPVLLKVHQRLLAQVERVLIKGSARLQIYSIQ